MTQLERVQNDIGQAKQKIGTQKRLAHKRNLKKGTRIDLEKQKALLEK